MGPSRTASRFYDVTQRNARRESAATAFLKPARKRPNLTVQTRALATQVLVENGRAIGLQYRTKEALETVHAERAR